MAADEAAKIGGTAHDYLESQGDIALQELFASLDRNADHILTRDETAKAQVRLVGYSFGAIQAANFSRALADTREPVEGYTLAAPIRVESLVLIDPVNSTPVKHTDGVLNNVKHFTNFYQRNTGPSVLHLTNSATGLPVNDLVFDGDSIPIGDPIHSAATDTRQIHFNPGTWSNRTITRPFDASTNGTIKGSEVDHATMPFFVYDEVVAALR